MALPYEIKNGDVPDAAKLQANFEYLAAVLTSAIQTGTYAEMKLVAAADPATPFFCIAALEDGITKQLLCYMGDAAQGDGGFVVLGGGATNTTEEG